MISKYIYLASVCLHDAEDIQLDILQKKAVVNVSLNVSEENKQQMEI